MNIKIVKLKSVNMINKTKGIDEGACGFMFTKNQEDYFIMVPNNNNQGDYIVLKINQADVVETNMVLPENLAFEMEEYIEENYAKIIEKEEFNNLPFSECDYVELVVEKGKYLKHGLKKGATGVIATNKAIKNKILVDFGGENEDFDGFLLVDFSDIKKID